MARQTKPVARRQRARAKTPKAESAPRRGSSDADRLSVYAHLQEKRRALYEGETALRRRLNGATSTERGLILHAVTQTILEIDRVESRASAILSDEPFVVLSPDEQKALLSAIQEVGRRASVAAAVVDLVSATLELVNTFKAKDTQP